MIKLRMTIGLLLISAIFYAHAEILPPEVLIKPPASPPPGTKNWEDSFVEVTYDKKIVDNVVSYNYYITNIGNVSIGTIKIGSDHSGGGHGCQVPPENIDHFTTSIPEWTAKLEPQTENPNQCIVAHNLNRDYPLEPGQILTITAHLKKDDPVFENLHWVIIFTRAPTRLRGEVKPAKADE